MMTHGCDIGASVILMEESLNNLATGVEHILTLGGVIPVWLLPVISAALIVGGYLVWERVRKE